MIVTSMQLESGRLIIESPDKNELYKLANEKLPGEYQIIKKKKRRSLDANGYAWVLIDKIAATLCMTKVEIYRNAIRSIGGVTETVCTKNSSVEKLCQGWERNGLGWQTETMPSKFVLRFLFLRQKANVCIDR